jgi:hypothetical protein
MANSQIDVSGDVAIDSVTKTAAGTVTNDVRVTITNGLDKDVAYRTLTAIRDAIISDRITLE